MKQSVIADCIEQELPAPIVPQYVYTFRGSGPDAIAVTDGENLQLFFIGDHPDISINLIAPGGEWITMVAHQPHGMTWAVGIVSRDARRFPGEIVTTIQDNVTVLTITTQNPLEVRHG